jgi:hypothetical protein
MINEFPQAFMQTHTRIDAQVGPEGTVAINSAE